MTIEDIKNYHNIGKELNKLIINYARKFAVKCNINYDFIDYNLYVFAVNINFHFYLYEEYNNEEKIESIEVSYEDLLDESSIKRIIDQIGKDKRIKELKYLEREKKEYLAKIKYSEQMIENIEYRINKIK